MRRLAGFPQPSSVAAAAGRLGAVDVRGNFLAVYTLPGLDRVAKVPAGKGPTHVGTDGRRLYVVDTRGDAVAAFRVRPNVERAARADVPGSPYGMAVDPRRSRLWVTVSARNQLVAISTDQGALRRVRSYPTVRQPNSVAVDPSTGHVYVAGRAGGVVQIIAPQF